MQNTKRLESNSVFKTKQNKKKCVEGLGKTLTPEAGVSKNEKLNHFLQMGPILPC